MNKFALNAVSKTVIIVSLTIILILLKKTVFNANQVIIYFKVLPFKAVQFALLPKFAKT